MKTYRISRCRKFPNEASLNGVDVQKDSVLFFDFKAAQEYIDKHIPDDILFEVSGRGVYVEDTLNKTFWQIEVG